MDTPNEALEPSVRDALATAYLLVQKKYEDAGKIPKHEGTVLSRYRGFWTAMGAIHLGLLIGAMTLLCNFIVINFILHLAPS